MFLKIKDEKTDKEKAQEKKEKEKKEKEDKDKKEKEEKAKKDIEKHPKDNTEIEKIKPITNNEEGSQYDEFNKRT